MEDINSVSRQLFEEISKGNENSAKIQKLSALLGKISKVAQYTARLSESSQCAELYAKCPAYISQETFNQCSQGRNQEREYILANCMNQEGNEGLVLKKDLPIEKLTRVCRTLESIGYPVEREG